MPTLAQLAASGPPSGAYPFIFTDESGVVSHDPSQPFYGIGMLKLSDAGRWNDGLNEILDRMVSALATPGVPVKRSAYELKFSDITGGSVRFYYDLVDYYVRQPDGYFCALIVDKTVAGIEPIAACGSTWNALIKYSVTLLGHNIKPGEKAIVISDNFQKPRKDPQYYERQLVSGLGEKAANVVMIESASSAMLQLVDVLLGSVLYHYKRAGLAAANAHKVSVADRLAGHYKVPTLGRAFTRTAPNYFSVWPLRPYIPYRP